MGFNAKKQTRKPFKKSAYKPKQTYTRLPKPEYRRNYVTGSYLCDTTGALTLLNGLTRGDDTGNRDGRKIIVKSINLRGVAQVTPASGTDQLHRVMLVRYLKPNGVAPAITDILQAPTVQSGRNRARLSDFQVIYDKVINLNASAESGSKRFLKMYKKCNIEVNYNAGDAGTIADITQNALYLITLGSNVAGATAGTFEGVQQLTWIE